MISAQIKDSATSTLSLLEDFANRRANGFLKCSANGISWFIYLRDGMIFHANFSIDLLDRLEQNIYRVLRPQLQQVDVKVFEKMRQQLEGAKLDDFYPSYDYQILRSLVEKKQISTDDGAVISKEITKETLRSFLLVTDCTYGFVTDERQFPILWCANFLSLSKECQDEINSWRDLGKNFYSPYQRPFIVKASQNNSKYDYLKKFLIGVDFNQLGLQTNRSAIRVAQSLKPLMADGVVGLRPPKSQYLKLPKLINEENSQELGFNNTASPQYKIVCVDDSPTILQRMNDFLDNTYFEIFLVQDSAAALTKIITVKPHAILLDIDMPNIDGYKLCAMIRRSKGLQKVPIMMVTSNAGVIDRARAKLAGATDYLTKPFTQVKLNHMVSKHVVQQPAAEALTKPREHSHQPD
jgi:two-component system, chemotaxis family, response regulator PixG